MVFSQRKSTSSWVQNKHSQRLVHWGLATQVYIELFWGGCFVLKVKFVQGKSHMLCWELGFFSLKLNHCTMKVQNFLINFLYLLIQYTDQQDGWSGANLARFRHEWVFKELEGLHHSLFCWKEHKYMKDATCHKPTMIHLYFICMYIRIYIYTYICLYLSKKTPTDPWNIPQSLNYLLMKEILSYLYFGISGVCSRDLLDFSYNLIS